MVLEHQENAETRNAEKLDPDEYRLITDAHEVNQILDRLGVNHDTESIVLEDSYHSIFTNGEEYWACHHATPLNRDTCWKIE